MNQKSDGPITSAEDSVHELVAEFHRLEDQGSPISSADFIAQHSEHAEALQSYFAGIAAVNGMTDPPPLEQTFIPSDTQAVGNDQTVIEDSVSINANRRVSADAPPTKFGRYKILKELGRGAMGAVYLAQDEQLDRKVALKIPQFGGALNSGLLERFYREARAAGNLRHPGICPVYDVGEIDGQHYITMAYIEGRPLRDFSKSSKRQADKQTARVIRKIALAMAEAHDQNVIHRDLKPANIMIDTKNEPVVMDFGLARRAAEGEERLTHTGTVIGTPAYMSPEQVDGDNENVGPAADIYSLGVIFYELLTGELPFQGNLMSILKQISMKQPRPPVELHADVDLFLQALCLKMLEKDVKDRPESMSQIAKELSDWLQGKHAPTDESAMLETSQAPARSKKKTASTVEVTDPMATPGIAREVPESEESPDFDDAPLAATTVAPRRAVSAATSPPANHRRRLAIGGFGGAALLLAGITFFINLGGKYDVEITVDDPSISLKVDGDDVLIDGAGSTIRLSAGTHTLLMERDGFEAELDDFVVKKEGKNVIHVAVSDGKTMIARTPEKQPEKKVAPHSPASPGTLISAVEGANNAIQFTGKPSRASMPTLSIPEDIKQFCVEGFVTFGDVNASQQVFGFPYEFILGCGPSGLMLHYAQAASRADLTPNFTPEDSGTYHIAAVFDGDNVRLYVDGRMVGERKTKGGLAPNGRTLDVGYGSDAVIDELRVSDNARYSEDFTPPAASQQFQPDEHTLALYHFDEDHGNVAKDSSGNGHDGKIIGAKWVKAGGDATSKPQVVETSTYPGRFALSFPEREESYVEVATLDSKLMDSLLRDKKLNLTIEFWLLRDKGKIEPHDHYAGWSDSYLFVRSAAGSAYVDGGEWGGRGAPPVGFYDAFAPTRTVKNEAVWTHVAAVLINPTEYRLFIDGKLVDTKPAQWGWPGSVDPFQLMAQAAGMMGETRVSTTARYDKDFTPEFDFKPDEHTLALYHFDEGSGDVLKDSSGNGHHGKIVGAKWLQAESAVSSAPAEPGANNALAFSDESTYVECPDVELDFTKPHTMEVWLRADVAYGNLLSWSNRTYPRFVLGGWGPGSGTVVFEQQNYKGPRSRSFDRDGWVHVAGVQAEDKCRIYVDGKLAKETDNPLLGDTSERSKGLRIGGGMPYFRSLNGELDEVRVSGVARYSADFTPQRRFQADADTLALYHFDEGTGDVLKDSSGNGHDGRIVGAKWVRPAGGAPSNATRIDLLRDYSPDPTSASEKKPDGTWVIYNGDLEFPRRIQGAYLLSVAFNQTGSYGGELKVLLPVGNSHVELVIPDDVNAENQGAGLHLVDGQPSTVNGTRFSKRKDQTLTTEVRRAGDRWQITAALDGQTFFNDVFNESQFSVAESRQPRQRGVIRIGSTSLTFHIKAVDLWDGTSPSKPPITRSSETAVPTSPRPNGERKSLETSLRFSDPDDEVTIPTLVDDSDALTIELWLQRDSSHLDAHSQIIGFGPESSIGSNADSALDFVMPGVGGEDGPKGGWDIHGVGQPIHVAGVRDPEKNELRLYYDGKLIQTSSGPIRRGSGPLHIASSEYQWAGDGEDHSFSGWIDEIRISKSVRYQADFQPERRFENDSQTTALYHFDEGRGNVLKDVSGNGHDGKIVGAKWVRADSSELPLLNRPSGLKGSLAFPKEAKSAFVD
ncbi:MAG: protein kinase, partial [Planctomycetaceae bacterium]|nr:protein kinase [Planctomycetaceae bacterium]